MDFEIVSEIVDIETIAVGNGVRDRARLRKQHGRGRWRKLKGVASVRLLSGRIRLSSRTELFYRCPVLEFDFVFISNFFQNLLHRFRQCLKRGVIFRLQPFVFHLPPQCFNQI